MKKDSIYVVWRVQVRQSRQQKWRIYGTYETREVARAQAFYLRAGRLRAGRIVPHSAYGFGNTRVVRVERGGK